MPGRLCRFHIQSTRKRKNTVRNTPTIPTSRLSRISHAVASWDTTCIACSASPVKTAKNDWNNTGKPGIFRCARRSHIHPAPRFAACELHRLRRIFPEHHAFRKKPRSGHLYPGILERLSPGYPRCTGLAPEEMVLAGMAVGYADTEAVINRLVSEREPVDAFATFMDR